MSMGKLFDKDKNPAFDTLLERIVYNIADYECQWQGDAEFECGIFAEVFLDAKALAIIDFLIQDAIALPHYWIVQKIPVARCIPYYTLEELKEWWDTLYEEQNRSMLEAFEELRRD